MSWLSILKKHPVIAAFRDVAQIDLSRLSSQVQVLFLLGGNIFELDAVVTSCQQAGKWVFVDIDLLKGIAQDEWGVKYLASKVRVQGLITTKARMVKSAKNEGLLAIQRVFVLDSESLSGALKVIKYTQPHAIEILPGIIWPKIASWFLPRVSCPVIAGGFITTQDEVKQIIDSGALTISTSAKDLIFKGP